MTQCLVIRYHPGWSPGSHTGRVGGARLPAAGAACNGSAAGGTAAGGSRAGGGGDGGAARGADTCFGGSALTALGRAASAAAPSGLLASLAEEVPVRCRFFGASSAGDFDLPPVDSA